jgi:HK97 family phage prohead protease
MEQKDYKIKKADIFKSASDGILSGYANVYNIEDLQGDISRLGCFAKTVSENHKSMKIYKNHRSNEFVGVPLKLDAYDPYGLYMEAKIIMDTQLGKDTYQEAKFMFENGFECGFSIGGWVMKRDKQDSRIITEFKLDEVSVLTMQPANQLSMVDMVKSIQAETELTQDKFWQTITKAYDSQFSDNILKSLEQFLTLKESSREDTLGTVEPSANKLITNIYELFKN